MGFNNGATCFRCSIATMRPEEALTHWGITCEPVEETVGNNKKTWRVGPEYWLTADAPSQAKTWENVDTILESSQLQGYQTPKPVPTRPGKKTIIHDRYAWRLTRHIPGKQPQANSHDHLEAVAAGLATLHRQLSKIKNHNIQNATIPEQHVASAQALLTNQQLPYTPDEQKTLLAGLDYLSGNKQPQPPAQLIHGDPSYPNLRLNHKGQLRGILDWDTACIASPIYDLAVVAQTVLFRSDTAHPLAWLDNLISIYQDNGGRQADTRQLLTAVLTIKYESINTHGSRYLQGAKSFDLTHSQAAKVKTTLTLLTNL